MIGHLLREERGMALGLAIIVVVIVGVMGAGFLTFVATDLQAVLEVNRGEQAFELAEGAHHVVKLVLAAILREDAEEVGRDRVERKLARDAGECPAGLVSINERGRHELRKLARIHQRLRQQVKAAAHAFDLPFVTGQGEQSGCVAPR